jgi:hypothetical protein
MTDMDHDYATKSLAAERYAMDEMSLEERDQFEGHFFDCLTCGDAVRDAVVFIEGGRIAVRENRSARPSQSRWATVPGYAAAAMLAGVIGYQNLAYIPRLIATQEPAIQVPAASALTASRSAEERIPASRAHTFQVDVDEKDASGRSYAKYHVQVRDSVGATPLEIEIPGEQGKQTLPIIIGKNRLRPGRYELRVDGIDADGRRSNQASGSFVVEDR